MGRSINSVYNGNAKWDSLWFLLCLLSTQLKNNFGKSHVDNERHIKTYFNLSLFFRKKRFSYVIREEVPVYCYT